MRTKAIFASDPGGFFATHDVVCKEHNFLEGEFTLLEPGPKLNGSRLSAPDASNPRVTSPTKSLGNTGIRAARHITTARITLHRTPKQSDVPQKANGVRLIAK